MEPEDIGCLEVDLAIDLVVGLVVVVDTTIE